MSDHPTSRYPVVPDFTPPDDKPPKRRNYWSSTPPWYVMMVAGILIVMLAILLILLYRDDGTETTAGEDTTTSITSTTVESTITVPSTSSSSTSASSSTAPSSTSSSTTTTVTSTTSTTTSSTTSTTTSSTTTSTTSSTTTSTTVDPTLYETAVWPWFDSSIRYTDPVEAAEGFALDFLGYDKVFAGEFMPGDNRSGEVEIRSFQPGPATLVLVRQLGADDTWWVLGSVTDNIRVLQPEALDEIDSPLTVSGESVAFEAAVDVELRADVSVTPLFSGIVMGGATELMPFEETFTFDDPDEGRGALVLFTISARDGGVQEASVFRVVFGS